MFTVTLKNGQRLEIKVPRRPQPAPQEDGKKNYANMVLEFGMLFKCWLELIKMPDRNRGIRLLKMSMIIFKAGKNLSKYAYEIVRLLVQQLFVLSEKEAHEQFYGMFVNTQGRVDSHVACDDRMEWAVHAVKKHIKHMFSNKSEKNIATRTRAIAGISDISDAFDVATHVLKRQKKHTYGQDNTVELRVLEDLRIVRPFRFVPNREHHCFQEQKASVLATLDSVVFEEWIMRKVYEFATEHNV